MLKNEPFPLVAQPIDRQVTNQKQECLPEDYHHSLLREGAVSKRVDFLAFQFLLPFQNLSGLMESSESAFFKKDLNHNHLIKLGDQTTD